MNNPQGDNDDEKAFTLTYRVAVRMTPSQARTWADEYGKELADVRDDLAQYIETGLQNGVTLSVEEGCTEEITVTPTGRTPAALRDMDREAE